MERALKNSKVTNSKNRYFLSELHIFSITFDRNGNCQIMAGIPEMQGSKADLCCALYLTFAQLEELITLSGHEGELIANDLRLAMKEKKSISKVDIWYRHFYRVIKRTNIIANQVITSSFGDFDREFLVTQVGV